MAGAGLRAAPTTSWVNHTYARIAAQGCLTGVEALVEIQATGCVPTREGRNGRLDVFQLGESEGVADFFVQVHPDAVWVREKHFHYARVKLLAGVSFDFLAGG